MIRKTHAKTVLASDPMVPVTPTATSTTKTDVPDVPKHGWLRQFFGIDLRTLAFFRIALAISLLADLFMRCVDIDVFYTDGGTMPRAAVLKYWNAPLNWSAYQLFDSAAGIGACFGINAVFLLLLLVGWNTRLVSIVCWMMLCFIDARNPLILQGGDIVLRCLMFWAMFLPLGSYLSLDAKKAVIARLPGEDPKKPVSAFSWGTFGILMQVAFIYWFAALLKTDPSWWNNGYAIYIALNVDLLTRPLGRVLRDVPFVAYALTYVTIWLEAFGPFLAFFPFRNGPARTACVFIFWFFHLVALQSMMYLGPFPWSCALAWVLFLPPWFWDSLNIWWQRGKEGGIRRRLSAWSHAYLPMVADKLEEAKPARRPARIGLSMVGNIIAACALILITTWNIRTVNAGVERYLPQQYNFVVFFFHLDQAWDMFSPKPMTSDGWYILAGQLRNGKMVDFMPYLAAYGEPTPVTWDKPEQVGEQFRNERWRKYFLNLWSDPSRKFNPYLLKYVAKRWNSEHKGGEEVCWLELEYMHEETPDNYAPIPTPTPVSLSWYACFPEFERNPKSAIKLVPSTKPSKP